ncbi:MAG: pentapeptide repeat-containing protein [Deltaproteobacteria bacterium]|nr:MAG: pentapeptide repeat-containing protein [Deltaproteobacteria bacterium]
MLDVLVHPAKLRLALDVLGDLLRLAGQRHRGGRNSLFRRAEGISLEGSHGAKKASTRAPARANQRQRRAGRRTPAISGRLRHARRWRYRPFVDFTAHQAPMALQRLKDQGGFNGDRIESCAMPTVFASGSDWLRTVVDKSDLAEGNLAGTRIRETTFAHTALRKVRLRAARLERVELYFCDLNEIDAAQLNGRRLKIHGCEAMNAIFSGASLSVARFEDTKLYRAKFDGALIVRTVFADARLGATSMEKADFSGARLIDVSMRGANLMAASFARAMLIGVDLRDAALAGADFSGATTIGCHLPAEFGS